MKPRALDYVRARSIDHAIELLSTGADARVLAGGQSMMPAINMRLASPDVLIDIGRIDELRSIEVGSHLRIGAAVTQAEVAGHPDVLHRWPMLTAAIAQIGQPPIRNRGTVCGSLAHNDPQAELPAVAVALEAVVTSQSRRGTRSIPADEFFRGTFTTSLEDDEIVTAVDFPEPALGHGWAFQEFSQQPGDLATAGAAVVLNRREAAANRVVVFGVGVGPTRATLIEEAIRYTTDPSLDPQLVDRWGATLSPFDDAHASAHTKVQHAKQIVVRAVAEARGRMS